MIDHWTKRKNYNLCIRDENNTTAEVTTYLLLENL